MANTWHYAVNGEQKGPVTEMELRQLIESGQLPANTMVWSEGMSDWQMASSVPALQGSPAAHDPNQIYQPPQAQIGSATSGAPITSYLWQSIVCTLFCCMPAGVVAIVYAAKVDSLAKSGQLAEAQKASQTAKTWCWVSFGVGLVVIVIYLAAIIFAESPASSGFESYP